ncbi:hypothetical protein G5S_0933 [Chlamydia pecorum E58]|uniref:Uncharacterized protein n=1 Tax=Chlamydia pecorum (strain ATCC VR-628 / DSM 29919 / E58) TaxID=331635 RepID=A0AA34WIE1_CHLPE|nr:hypothetical protein G5S_0933 [Chlamydia pecorum E58]
MSSSPGKFQKKLFFFFLFWHKFRGLFFSVRFVKENIT